MCETNCPLNKYQWKIWLEHRDLILKVIRDSDDIENYLSSTILIDCQKDWIRDNVEN